MHMFIIQRIEDVDDEIIGEITLYIRTFHKFPLTTRNLGLDYSWYIYGDRWCIIIRSELYTSLLGHTCSVRLLQMYKCILFLYTYYSYCMRYKNIMSRVRVCAWNPLG